MLQFLKKFFKGFVYAFEGILSSFQERNMRVHGVAAVVAILSAVFLELSITEWCIILILIAMVWAAEAVNTAIEAVCNSLRDECGLPYSSTKRARDVAAGAVLIIACTAAVIGGVIFFPRIAPLLP